ncbi:MT-A70 family methyltransferase [Microbacterium sp. GXS0129]
MSIHINHNLPDKTPLPGTFRAALCDPPWSLQQKGDLGAANHYDLMTDERILGMGEAMQEIMAENSFCFLWVTTATVPLGIKVLEAWGYRYTSFYFWAKPRLMLGNTFRNSGELLLLGVRGKGTKVAFKGQPNWGMHALQAHSRKPEEIHLIVERLVGGGRAIPRTVRSSSRTVEQALGHLGKRVRRHDLAREMGIPRTCRPPTQRRPGSGGGDSGMRGVKHAGRYRAALARGEVLEDLPVAVRRRDPARPHNRADQEHLVDPRPDRSHGRHRRRAAVVVATPKHLALSSRTGGQR